MGQILFSGSGGGTVTSDELTATKELVLEGKSYVGSDTDDEAGTGTMKNIGSIDYGPSLTISGNNLYCRMNSGAHIQNASSGYPEVAYDLDTVRNAINYTDSSRVLPNTTICGMTGTMPTHSSGQHANSNGVNNSGIWMYVPYGYYYNEGNNQAWVYRTKAEMKDTFKSAYGVNSCSGFNLSSSDDPSNWGKISVGLKGLSNGSNQPWYGCSVYVDNTWKANIEGNTTGSTTISELSEGSHSVKVKNYYRCNTDLDSSGVVWGSEQSAGSVTAYRSKTLNFSKDYTYDKSVYSGAYVSRFTINNGYNTVKGHTVHITIAGFECSNAGYSSYLWIYGFDYNATRTTRLTVSPDYSGSWKYYTVNKTVDLTIPSSNTSPSSTDYFDIVCVTERSYGNNAISCNATVSKVWIT